MATSCYQFNESSLQLTLYIKVKVGCPANQFKGVTPDHFLCVDIAARAIENQANQEICKFLHHQFRIPQSAIQIYKGQKSRYKQVLIYNPPASLLSFLETYDNNDTRAKP